MGSARLSGQSPLVLVTVGPRLPDLNPYQGELSERTGIVQRNPEPVSGELHPRSPRGMCCLRRNSLPQKFQKKGLVRGLVRLTGESAGLKADPETVRPHHSIGVLLSSHLSPCLSSALGLPIGPRSWSSSMWRLSQASPQIPLLGEGRPLWDKPL